MKVSSYQRIAKGGNLFVRAVLYAGEDHLLYTRGQVIRQYRRFSYEDIEALYWRRDVTPKVMGLLLMALLGLFAGIALIFGSWIGFAIWLSALLVVLVRLRMVATAGGYCRVTLQMPASTTTLIPINTQARAQSLISRIERVRSDVSEEHADDAADPR